MLDQFAAAAEGMAAHAGDVDAFFLALVDYARYEMQYPECHGDRAGDIDAFFALQGGE